MERELKSTYIPSRRWGPNLERWGGIMGIYTVQTKLCKWETFGWELKASCKGEHSWLTVGRIQIKVAAWINSMPLSR